MLVAALGLFFLNSRDDSELIQAHILPDASLGPKAYIGNTVGQGSRYSKATNSHPHGIPGRCYACLLKAFEKMVT